MRRTLGWLGLLLAALIGAALSFGTLYLFAPVASALWLLLALPLAAGAAAAALLAGPLERWTRARTGVRRVLAGALAVLPLGGLVAAMLASPPTARAAAPADPRGPHRTLRTPGGSTLAVWSLAPTGAPRATPVIFLHGGPGSFTRNRDFDLTQGLRRQGFRAVFYDQAGSGASGNLPVPDYTVAHAVADLDALRAALGADKVVLWGQSWGASLAAAYARAHPSRVGATIIDSPGDFPGEPHGLDYRLTDTDGGFKPSLRDATLYLLIGHAPQLAERWATQDDARAFAQARGAKTVFVYGYQCKGARTKLRRPLSPGGGNLYPQLRLQEDLERQPRVAGPLSRAPALLVRPACDYLPPETAARYMQAYPAAKRIDVPGRGHAFFGHEAEQSARVAAWADKALAGVR